MYLKKCCKSSDWFLKNSLTLELEIRSRKCLLIFVVLKMNLKSIFLKIYIVFAIYKKYIKNEYKTKMMSSASFAKNFKKY